MRVRTEAMWAQYGPRADDSCVDRWAAIDGMPEAGDGRGDTDRRAPHVRRDLTPDGAMALHPTFHGPHPEAIGPSEPCWTGGSPESLSNAAAGENRPVPLGRP